MKIKLFKMTLAIAIVGALFFVHSCVDDADFQEGNEAINQEHENLNKTLTDYELITLDVNKFKEIAREQPADFTELDFGIESHPEWIIPMKYFDLKSMLDEDFEVVLVGDNHSTETVETPELHGMIAKEVEGEPVSNLILNGDYLEATIAVENETFKIEPLFYFEESAKDNEYVVYNVKDLIPQNRSFENDGIVIDGEKVEDGNEPTGIQEKRGGNGAALTMLADYQFYKKYNNYSRTRTYMMNRWSESAITSFGYYNGATRVKIGLYKCYIYWTYGSRNYKPRTYSNYVTFLHECSDYYDYGWYGAGDVNYFFTGDPVVGAAGSAFQSKVCVDPSQAFGFGVHDYSGYGGSLIMAHEMGHSFGATHTYSGRMGGGNMLFNNVSKRQINSHAINHGSCMPWTY